ncbi:UNVERIFIED_ORG: cobalt-zinc-cadmium efflux system membrane fusion protein [Zoogloea ramigera]|uniref:Efflux RND transporter periplasmic adaptor subunit n=1 Tax=Duganella zoogloeoides TaxID=75659 RepID=A0ABZ0XSR3_9BURK|nr:efflux RND transporter periplasmic adaptor subunit [Duganella zoogloeoides]WQH02616.1 efflux RND transporter periplasmic adaptor subunit [Duganella zoogloeoides]
MKNTKHTSVDRRWSRFIPGPFLLAGLVAVGLIAWGAHGMHAMQTANAAAPATPAPELVREADAIVVPAASPLRRTLVVAPVQSQSLAAPFVLPATVEADPARLVKITTPMAGRVVRLEKQLGDAVTAGDILFVIDAPDLAQAGADAARAQAALTLAASSLQRQQALDHEQLTARGDLEQAQSDYAQAASEAARAAARLRQSGVPHGGDVKGGTLAVRAPIAGRVVELSAARGMYWNDATAPLMTVADLSHVFVAINAQEKDLAQVYVGQAAHIRLDAYPEPLQGAVRYVGEMLDPDTRTVKLRVPFENRDGRLKPGMFATATLSARTRPAILVPLTAVVQGGFASRVFVETAPWRFTAREVTLGTQVGDNVEVLSGLAAGARIVVKDGVLLDD